MTSFSIESPSPSSRSSSVLEWIFRRGALRTARGARAQPSEATEKAVNQAKLLLEVARRVAEPVESLPEGARPAVVVGMYRDAAFWALTAEHLALPGSASASASDLAQLWAVTSPDRLLKAAGDDSSLGIVRTTLVERPPGYALDTTADEAARARAFVEALLWDLEAPVRRIEHLQVQRWTRTALVLVALALAGLGVRALLRGPNLAKARVFKTSSAFPGCTSPNQCSDIFFHTEPQESPWIDFDLGSVKSIRQVEVTNRSDCCAERAIPLIVEVSVD
ncbi:MAG: hypothetical protein H7X95_03815, partial [Deltaproteobacteria bacterium]|nr:hypothetical protein [Deltaproteobacteria bacterium]